jgi:hypothetical protein
MMDYHEPDSTSRDRKSRVNLDAAPPSPPAANPSPMAQLGYGGGPAMGNASPMEGGPTGAMMSDPKVLVLKSLAQIEEAVRILSVYLPGITPLLADLTGRLQQTVPQAMMAMDSQGVVPGAAGGMGDPAQNPLMALIGGASAPGASVQGAGQAAMGGMMPPPMGQ